MSDAWRLVFGCVLTAVGVALAVAVSERLGTGALLVGIGIAIHGLHRLGRSGPDRFEPRG